VKDSGKSSAIVAKMIEGKVSKFISENTLLEQSLSTVSDNPTVRSTHTLHKQTALVWCFMFTARIRHRLNCRSRALRYGD
jgi:translation elongation factor EF-Ts